VGITVDIPGRSPLQLEYVLCDLNGTLTDRGSLIEGAARRLGQVSERLEVHLLSADTFGTLDALATELAVSARRVTAGDEKLAHLERLGAQRCIAIGNGNNDVTMLRAAALGIAVTGPEGASPAAWAAADVVCGSINDALDLLLDDRTLVATLRP
jgi:soluble P-type ATPase